jgi:glycine/D-amino acid oxidase-like deaminating enzyme
MLGEKLEDQFLHPIDMLRLFRSEQQVRFWQRRVGDASARPLLGDRFEASSDLGERLQAPFGGFVQHHTGYVEVNRLLETLRTRLQRDGRYRRADVAYEEIRSHTDRVEWRDVSARHAIFCEGYRAQANPWFGWLPFQPDKGEILTLSSQKHLSRRIVNGAHWLIPLVDGRYRFGSTHDHRCLDETPTEPARTELLLGLQRLLGYDPDCSVIEHRAGVRPATRDRLPLIGRHPNEPNLVLFNGFGARGSLTIPWYAARLADHLLEGADLPAEADLHRHA